MTLWLHMFSWVVVHVLIKLSDLVLTKAMIIKHKSLYHENHFYPPQIKQLA
jgi:uncharacterized protein (DUF983 family)